MGDVDAARSYGAGQPGFGGVFRDGDELVVLFTENLAEHQESLRRIVDRPDLLTVRAASRTLAEVQIAKSRVTDRLLGAAGPGGVTTVAIAVRAGQFVVEVGLDPYDDAHADLVRGIASPDEIVVRSQPRPRLL